MACYHPITAYRARSGPNPNGSWPVVFNVKLGYIDKEVTLPCGQCIGCRLEKSRQWAIRCVQESKMNVQNCFITLTYNEEFHYPMRMENYKQSLNKRDWVLFMKRLRKECGTAIKFFHCGEYGESGKRPHHHACLFGHDFLDKRLWCVRNGVRLYRSRLLEKLWPYGFSTIGEVNFESAAYVARYVVKKVTGEKAAEHYKGVHPEYITMSRSEGIGKNWYLKYQDDILTMDAVITRGGIKCKTPRYYDNIYDKDHHAEMLKIKAKRKASINPAEQYHERLEVKERIALINLNKLQRSYENG